MIDNPTGHRRSASADAAAATADRRRAVLLAVAIVAMVALVATVAWQAIRLAGDDAVDDARHRLRDTAGAIVGQVLSHDGMTAAADRGRARRLVTADFARRAGLDRPATPVTDLTVRWSPSTVAVVDADATSGTVLIDGTLVRTEQGRSTSIAQTITADLVEAGGRWLVDQIEVVR